MHVLRVAFLLLITLAGMRAASWLVGWLLHGPLDRSVASSAVLANLACLAGFAAFLVWNSIPGMPFDDYEALLFGAVFYTVCMLLDLKWAPWRSRIRGHGAA